MRLGRKVIHAGLRTFPKSVRRVLLECELSDRRETITEHFSQGSGNIVQAGPFKGMEIPTGLSWGDGDRLPKLLGSYEAELHRWISRIVKQRYDIILDVGCAEGYYAVGLARCTAPPTKVLAFDISADARRICALAAEMNGVAGRVLLFDRCSPQALRDVLSKHGRSFALLDCEGAELELLRPDLVPNLRTTDLLVECHDFLDNTITETLCQRLSSTHSIERVDEQPRDFNQFPFLKGLGGFERSLALCEFRPEMMHWLLCISKEH
jgi:SAM-dependent methyltransferase